MNEDFIGMEVSKERKIMNNLQKCESEKVLV